MMQNDINYKKLIMRLRSSNMDALVSSEEAAAAIENLLAERDAASEKMRGNCDECVNAETPAEEYPCYFCRFSVYGKNSGKDYWQWRGPMKDRE